MIAAVSLASCATAPKADDVAAIELQNMDISTSPSEDFYQYCNGGWMERTPFRDEFSRYAIFNVLGETNEERIKELFTSLASQKNERGSVGQKIVDLYSMGLDSLRLNREGAAPIAADLKEIEKMEVVDLSSVLAKIHREIGSPFFNCYVATDSKNSTNTILNFSQAGLSMGTRDYYLEQKYSDKRESYKGYIERLFTLIGYSEAEAKRATESVIRVEMAIAESSSSNVELRDPNAAYNITSIEEFKATYDAINWDEYAKELGLKLPEKLNVRQPRQLARVNEELKRLDLQTIKDYLSFNVAGSATSYLADPINEASFDFFGRTMSGTQQQQARWKRALSRPNNVLGEAVGQMYVEKYFPAEYKAQMMELVLNLQKALSIHIDQLEWMSDETKAKAQEKLSTIYIKIGYPDKWKDYSELEIDPSKSYWENMKCVWRWSTKENIAKLYRPVDREDWGITPQTVNAYYRPTTNEICFPAAILQPPFFNPTADDAVNYGAIGVIIGHEMTHGFDDKGRQFDKDGNLKDWWLAEDSEAFTERADQLVEQFNKIEVLPGVFANGAYTLGENIADQGGLRVAYTAMREAQGGVEAEPIDGFTSAQRFYIGYASVWAQHIRDEEIERRTNSDPHSLGEWRVNQTLKNIDTFYEAFGIESGEMYIAPEERVTIW